MCGSLLVPLCGANPANLLIAIPNQGHPPPLRPFIRLRRCCQSNLIAWNPGPYPPLMDNPFNRVTHKRGVFYWRKQLPTGCR